MIETAPPRVTLRNYFRQPYDSAIAAARTCYSPDIVTRKQVTEKQRASIGPATFAAGHHTVYQHAHFEFGLENVSRQFVWSFLHSHPFYNSEQQSQRYVRLDRPRAFLPPIKGEARKVYEAAISRAWGYYRQLSELLKPEAQAILADIWHLTKKSPARQRKKVAEEAEKKAIEVARYVLPLAAFTTLVHTVSGITLHRLWRMQCAGDTPYEASLVVRELVARVKEVDPQFFTRIGGAPLTEKQLPEWRFLGQSPDPELAAKQRGEFDARLNGRASVLIDYSLNAERVVAAALRATLGVSEAQMSDDAALDLLLNPAKNPYRLQTLNVSFHAPMMRALHHAHYTFAKRLSHTADSQDQRHRMVPGARPLMLLTDSPTPDYITPALIRLPETPPQARELYQQAITEAWAAKNRLLELLSLIHISEPTRPY